jgi:hypothetical protein
VSTSSYDEGMEARVGKLKQCVLEFHMGTPNST